MSRTRTTFFAAAAAVAGLTLTACGGGGEADKADGAANAAASGDLTFKNGTAKQNNANMSIGDLAADAAPAKQAQASKPKTREWVQLSSSAAGTLNPVVTNGQGFVLYRFDKDTAEPSKSNCFDDCEKTWPPLIVSPKGKVFIDGVNKEDVGFIKRSGGFQVTLGGWPVYLFSKDLNPGDTNGQGVNKTWFGVTPDGQRAGQDAGVGAEEPSVEDPGSGEQPGSGESSAEAGGNKRELVKRSEVGQYRTVDDASDPESAARIQPSKPSTGCVNVVGQIGGIGPEIASNKPIKLWSGDNCTGESLLLPNGTGDLVAQNFANKTRSIFIGEFA
ncbi:hypothetical protein [Streptomyces tauricus]|uniref:hypothetical protein n=1 Tax=Streptomyces tauricus TaxID=68274 RepID=UPI0022431198|nr:hypothetical protein [Streptomyces tauricus]MCW8103594.1 hypothetical protein [Streptomyces tauricus]